MPYKNPEDRRLYRLSQKALKERIKELESTLPKTIPEDRNVNWLKDSMQEDLKTLDQLQKLIKC